MLKNCIFLLIAFFLFQFSYAQEQSKKPCSAPEAKQFDFWIGKWKAEWEGGRGSNTVTKILNGCVIHEEFKASGEKPLIGISNSVYSPVKKKWLQTWVDNNGAYLDFSGEWTENRMILSRSLVKEGKTIYQRMVWYNITKKSFDWNWESSKDGKSWQVNWKIKYTKN